MSNEEKKVRPPRWAEWLLTFYCREELLEDLQGDLHEYFERNVKTKGARKARLIYIIDVLKFFRLYTIRKPRYSNLFNFQNMLGSYIKTSGRGIMRHKLFSAINIAGLAISMSVGMLIISILTDVYSYDKFHTKLNNIYRIITTDQFKGQPPMQLASTSLKAAKEIPQTIPGVEELTVMRRGFGGDANLGNKIVPVDGLYASASFFNVFTFPLTRGNPAIALRDPYSLVLTEKTAIKLFGHTDVLGKLIKFDTSNYIITGIAKDPPKFSSVKFDALASFSTVELKSADSDGGLMDWGNVYMNYIYFVAKENSRPETMQAALDKLCAKENLANKNRTTNLSIQAFKDVSRNKSYGNDLNFSLNPIARWVLIGLGLVVILSACFNYTNLSIARSLRRSREVGIRKVTGALKIHVLGQFITESVVISLLALAFSFLLYLFIRDQFMAFHPFLANLLSLQISVRIIIYFILLSLLIGIVSGLMPAVFYSRINAIRVLKDSVTVKLFRHINLRKTLIVVQYTFSLIFITATIIGFNQYKGFLSMDLGFSTANVINIRMQGNHSEVLKRELSQLPEVKDISICRIVTSIGSMYGTQIKYNDPSDSSMVWLNCVDEHYLPLHGHKFIAGRNLRPRPAKAPETEVIVNEQVLQRFNIFPKNPGKAIGESIYIDGKKIMIVGVLKDFHIGTVENKIEPTVIRYTSDESGGWLNVKVLSSDWPATMEAIASAWKKIDNIHPLDAKFYDEQIEENYGQFSIMLKVIGFFAFLAIFIASMGLFGMVVYATERRIKEVSIRKVLGAGEKNLLYLLSKGFLLLLIISAAIALPLTWLFFDKVVLQNFAYHQPINWGEIFLSVLVLMVIAFITIGLQTLKVVRSNPAKVLKTE